MLYIVKDSFNSPQGKSELVMRRWDNPCKTLLSPELGEGGVGVQKSELDFGRGELN